MIKFFPIFLCLIVSLIFVSGCVQSNKPRCGNGVLEQGETKETCCKDIDTNNFNCENSKLVCGDNICDVGEFEDTCPRDCESKEKFSIFEEGRFSVLVPKGYELLGEKHLQDLKSCYNLISNFLGITPYQDTTFLKVYISEDGIGLGYSNGIGLFYKSPKENIDMDLNNVKTNNPDGFLYKSSSTYCANTHEFVHVFVGHLPIPSWANEGIAEYTQKNIQEDSKNNFECKETGWYGVDFWGDDKEKLFQYSDLDEGYGSEYVEGAKWYHTAMCFWEYVDVTYGKEKIKKIFQRFDGLVREEKFQGDFVGEVLEPVLGADIKIVLSQRFGVTPLEYKKKR